MNYIKSLLPLCAGLLLFSACHEEALTPQIDTSNEYAPRLEARKDNSTADALIWQWYEQFHSAFIYDFSDIEFHWLWASTFSDQYIQFDTEDADDRARLDRFAQTIQDGFVSKYSIERLESTLPFRIFMCKQLNPTASSFSDKDTISTTNGQDAIIVAYQGRSGEPYDQQTLSNALSKSFALFFFDKLPKYPTSFVESREACNYSLVTVPTNSAIEGEFTSVKPLSSDKNSAVYKNHKANCCGYIRAYLPTYVQVPTEQVDFADYLAFLTCNDADYIRSYTKNYWRIAKRASIFIKFWKEVMDEDLIKSHNEKFPNEAYPLSISDFTYVEK